MASPSGHSSTIHPSHPGLASTASYSHSQQPTSKGRPSGALHTLSTLLLGHRTSTATEPAPPVVRLGKRQDGLGGGQDVGFSFWVSASARSASSTARSSLSASPVTSGTDDDVPPLEGRRHVRVRTNIKEELEVDLPPSPVGFPGAWNFRRDGNGWDKDGALLLPPPFLDGFSTKDSFDGLLGTRTARELGARARREARQLAKDRPPRPAFPQSLIRTASKLVTALGPPGGIDSGPFYRSWKDDPDDSIPRSIRKERGRLERAETGMRGFEFGDKLARKLADRLRKVSEGQEAEPPVETTTNDDGPARDEQPQSPTITVSTVRAATPMSMFAPTADSADAFSGFLGLGAFSPNLDESSLYPPTDAPLSTPFDFPAPPKPKIGPSRAETDMELSPPPLTPAPLPQFEEDATPRQSCFPLSRQTSAASVNDGSHPVLLSVDGIPVMQNSTSTTTAAPNADPLSQNRHPPSPFVQFLLALGGPLSYAFNALGQRSRSQVHLLIWITFGSAKADSGLASVGGLFGPLIHLVGFLFFVLVHFYALLVSTCSTFRSVALFSHWTFLNLTGRTDLSLVTGEYLGLCRKEWIKVAKQDGMQLNLWSVIVGLMELAAIQAMSKEKWLAEGPGGLVLLNGEEENEDKTLDPYSPGLGRPMIKRTAFGRTSFGGLDRPNFARKRTARRWTEDEGEGDSLLVTGGADSILEGTILNDSFDPVAHFSPTTDSAFSPDDMDDLPLIDMPDSFANFGFNMASSSPIRKPLPLSPLHSLAPSPRDFNNTLGSLSPLSRLSPITTNIPMSPPLYPVPASRPLHTLVKTLKRHARLATASYGLHSYIVAPPTPLFTPSGATLPHRIFSHLGGIDGKNVLHVAIQKDYLGVQDEETYEPQIYLLRDDVNCEVVCVIRGTQSLADIKTDLEASFDDVELPSLNDDGLTETFRAHAGILAAAKRLLNPEQSPLFLKLRTILEQHESYALVLVGHSLGAAIASTVAFLLGHYIPEVDSSPSSSDPKGRWTIDPSSGLPGGRPLRAICFAHPTTVDSRLARRCALGVEPLVLTVSLGSDVVVRMGVPQVREVRRTLGRLAKKRRKFLTSKAPGQHGKSEILSNWWRWKKLGGGEPGEKCDEVKAIEEKAWGWRQEVDGFGLHGPGAESQSEMMIPAGKVLHLDRLPAALDTIRRAQLDGMLEEDDDDDDAGVWGLYDVADPTAFFSCPLLEADLVKNHLPRCYLDAVSSL